MFKKLFGKKLNVNKLLESDTGVVTVQSPIILRKPKILPTTCQRCRCQYLASISDIHLDNMNRYPDYAPYVDCPVCGLSNIVKFDEETKYDETIGKVEATDGV